MHAPDMPRPFAGHVAHAAFHDEGKALLVLQHADILQRVAVDQQQISEITFLHEAKLVKSNSEARRLLKQRAVRIDGATVESEDYPCAAAQQLVLEVGKRRAIRVRVTAPT